MKICNDHWTGMREAIEHRGLGGLVSKSGEAAMDAEVRKIEEANRSGKVSDQTLKETFDPLMSMHWHYTNNALQCGGLYLLSQKEDGGDYCPVCEFEKHQSGFVAAESFARVAEQMREYCIEQGLIELPS